ncbi:MAG: hypothetical protein RRY20_00025 [Bilophila sp.]
MNALYLNDTTRGEGYGLFRLTDCAYTAESAITFSLQRSGDRRYLGRTGWQDAEEQLVPESVTATADAVELALLPAVVDQLETQETYRLSVCADGMPPAHCTLAPSEIIYARVASGGAVAAPVAPAPTPPPLPPVAPVEPAPVPPLLEPTPPLTMQSTTPPPATSHLGLILGVLVVLALLAAGGGWYLLRDKTPPPTEQQATPEATPAPATPEATPPPAEVKPEPSVAPTATPPPAETKPEPVAAPAATPPAEPAPAAPVTPPAAPATPAAPVVAPPPVAPVASKVQVRTFMQSKGTPQQALALARTLPKVTSEDQDAVFLLMEMAAEGGIAEAMLETARYYNPADTTPSGSIVKDAEQAFIWYTEAAAKARTSTAPETVPAVADGLASLRDWLKTQAETGSAEAANLLKKIQ